MSEEIGVVAGKVWNYLSGVEKASASRLVSATGLKANEVQRAIGWLAREEKITVTREGRSEYFSLSE